ncbi:hypothetical protein AAFN87_14750 [Solibacillus sp. CAU 1738]
MYVQYSIFKHIIKLLHIGSNQKAYKHFKAKVLLNREYKEIGVQLGKGSVDWNGGAVTPWG